MVNDDIRDPSDDDIRRRLRKAAYKGARVLEIGMAPIDPRDTELEAYQDPAEMHRMQRAAESAISAWVKSLPQATAPGADNRTPEEKRQQLKAAMETAEVREWLLSQGYERKEVQDAIEREERKKT